MKTSRAILNERSKKTSKFHKICTYDHPAPCFESEEVQGYGFSHLKSPPQQLVFHKEEIRLTPISLPTPPASPEFWGTSLQKWYQKKPLFTLTAKGQVKRIEKYLQIQKTLELCKREYEYQKQTEDMKRAYLDFEFREHQPLLFEDSKGPCVCPCNSSSSNYDEFIPTDFIPCSSPNRKPCLCKETTTPRSAYPSPTKRRSIEKFGTDSDTPLFRKSTEYKEEDKIIPTKIIKEGEKDPDERGIYKIIMKNKLASSPRARYMMKLEDFNGGKEVTENFEKTHYVKSESSSPRARYKMKVRDYSEEVTDNFERNHNMPNMRVNSAMPKIYLGNTSQLPFDQERGTQRVWKRNINNERNCVSCRWHPTDSIRDVKFDINDNEIS